MPAMAGLPLLARFLNCLAPFIVNIKALFLVNYEQDNKV